MNQPLIIDISIPIRPDLALWPGDVPYKIRIQSSEANGPVLNLGSVTMSLHTGTHIDAPLHFERAGLGAGELELDPFVGPAVVVDVSGKARIQVRDFESVGNKLAPRVLLKTEAWLDHARFPESIPVIESYVPAFLSERGVVLIGVDLPSVDLIDSKDLPNHHALHSRGIQILESLDLREVEPGSYDLIALPLRLEGADASPCRAVLIRR